MVSAGSWGFGAEGNEHARPRPGVENRVSGSGRQGQPIRRAVGDAKVADLAVLAQTHQHGADHDQPLRGAPMEMVPSNASRFGHRDVNVPLVGQQIHAHRLEHNPPAHRSAGGSVPR